jgi:DnaJ-class molecular chaperone
MSTSINCDRCNGAGYEINEYSLRKEKGFDNFSVKDKCPKCSGTGKLSK